MKVICKLLLPALLACAACSSGDGGNDGPVSFSADVQPIFTASCAVAGCHNDVSQAQGLNLSAGKAYGELVDQPTSSSSKNLVTSGSSADSFLIDKLKGNGTTRMPPTVPLSSAQIQLIASWIDDGAADN
jgi:hypothetical protein